MKIRREASEQTISTCRVHSWNSWKVSSIGYENCGVLDESDIMKKGVYLTEDMKKLVK